MDVKRLEETLVNLLQLFEELHALLERETGELAKMNLAVMAELNQRKEELAGRIEEQNSSLRRMISTIASELGLAPGATLGAVAAALVKKGDFPGLRRRLADAARRVREAAAVNGAISARFAQTAGMTLGFLGSVVNRSSVYGASGGYVRRSSVSVMINREA